MEAVKNFVAGIARRYTHTSLILRIVIGLVVGAILGIAAKDWTFLSILGDLFVGGLKAMAPILVFVIVAAALAQSRSHLDRRFGTVIFLYLLTTLDAAVLSVFTSYTFPQKIVLQTAESDLQPPQGLGEVFSNLLNNLVANPFSALTGGNYIGILFWAVLFGLAMKRIASQESKTFMMNISDAISQIVRWIIGFAPFGICGLVYTNVSTNGLSIFRCCSGA